MFKFQLAGRRSNAAMAIILDERTTRVGVSTEYYKELDD